MRIISRVKSRASVTKLSRRSCSASQKANRHGAKMDQELALAILLSGRSALLTGAAGTGKTHLLNNFYCAGTKTGVRRCQ